MANEKKELTSLIKHVDLLRVLGYCYVQPSCNIRGLRI